MFLRIPKKLKLLCVGSLSLLSFSPYALSMTPVGVHCELERDADDIQQAPDRELVLTSVDMIVREVSGYYASDVYLEGDLNGKPYNTVRACRGGYSLEKTARSNRISAKITQIVPLHKHLRDPNQIKGRTFTLRETPWFTGKIMTNGTLSIIDISQSPHKAVRCQAADPRDFKNYDCATGYYNSNTSGHCIAGSGTPNDHFAKMCRKYDGEALACNDTMESLCSINVENKIVQGRLAYQGYDESGTYKECDESPTGFFNAVDDYYADACDEAGGVAIRNCKTKESSSFLCSKKIKFTMD